MKTNPTDEQVKAVCEECKHKQGIICFSGYTSAECYKKNFQYFKQKQGEEMTEQNNATAVGTTVGAWAVFLAVVLICYSVTLFGIGVFCGLKWQGRGFYIENLTTTDKAYLDEGQNTMQTPDQLMNKQKKRGKK